MHFDFKNIDKEIEHFVGNLRKSGYSVFLDKKSKSDWLSIQSRSIEWKKRTGFDFIRKIVIHPKFNSSEIIEYWHFSIVAFYELKGQNYFFKKTLFQKSFLEIEENISECINEGYSFLSGILKENIPLINRS